MGNHKFRLSDMMPNSWFYKLKDMSRASRSQRASLPSLTSRRTTATTTAMTTTTTPKPYQPAKPPYLPNRPSYYFPSREKQQQESPTHPKATDTHFPLDPPRKSKRKARRKPAVPSISSRPTTPDGHCKPTSAGHLDLESSRSWPSSCDCKLTSSATDIIIDVEQEPSKAGGDFIDFIADLERHLPPIVTKPARKEPELGGRNVRRVKVRPCSPGLGTRRFRHKAPVQRRRGLEESLVVVKKSADPQRDFRESMMEMIMENDLRASKDLEELLACYLSLNSDEYHDVIVKVFEQIWFDLPHVRLDPSED